MLQPGLLTLSNVDPHLSFKNHLVSVGKASLHMRVLVLKQILRCSYVQNDQFFFRFVLVFFGSCKSNFNELLLIQKVSFSIKNVFNCFSDPEA